MMKMKVEHEEERDMRVKRTIKVKATDNTKKNKKNTNKKKTIKKKDKKSKNKEVKVKNEEPIEMEINKKNETIIKKKEERKHKDKKKNKQRQMMQKKKDDQKDMDKEKNEQIDNNNNESQVGQKKRKVTNSNHTNPQFYKVVVDEHMDKLRIPTAFNKYLRNESSGQVSLKVSSGNIWHVELDLSCEESYFMHGLTEFVSDHGIKFGHFLLFSYDGPSQFSVTVFDHTTCEVEFALHAQPSNDGAVEGEICRNEQINQEGGSARVCRETLDTSNEVERNTSSVVNTSEALALQDATGRPDDSRIRKRYRNLKDIFTSECSPKMCISKDRISRTSKRNKASIGTSDITSASGINIPTKIQSNEGKKHFQSILPNNSNDAPRPSEVIATIQRMPELISQRRPITEIDEQYVMERAKRFKSHRPFTTKIMEASEVYTIFFMVIPEPFAREHLPKDSRTVTLWDPQGKQWPVSYERKASSATFRAGWGAFAMGNCLEKSDICVFELIDKDYNIKVHVYRAVVEITPCIVSSNVGL